MVSHPSKNQINFQENIKFTGLCSENLCIDLSDFVQTIKEKYGLKLVYVWHAILGYWGGVLPTSETIKKYNPKIVNLVQSPGNLRNLICGTLYSLERAGVGIIDPSKIYDFYNDYHSYLVSRGVDGVKVDVMNLLEMLGAGCGGRVTLTRRYVEALQESVLKNFKDNNLICSMSQSTENIYSLKKGATARVSEDFCPNEPTFQTLHIATVAFVSLLVGEIVVPDWDMFYSDHYTAEFHAAARALGGCPVYVSDVPHSHNFKVLKKLVLPDGSILRARHAGRPTLDCLFNDPVTDGKSLLKIWNLNKLSGIIGAFNCQRGGVWPPILGAIYVPPSEAPSPVSGLVSPQDVDSLQEVADEKWRGECAVYAFSSGTLSKMPKNANFEVSLDHLKCDIYTVSPIRACKRDIQFAPIGLVDMYNSGGALEAMSCTDDPCGCTIKVKVRGCGRFGAYSSKKPRSCDVDTEEEEFSYNDRDGLLTFNLQGECKFREVRIVY